MELVNFGSETNIVIASEQGAFRPYILNVETPSGVTYKGKINVDQILSQQLALLKRRFNAAVAQGLEQWRLWAESNRLISSAKTDEAQVASAEFVKTAVRIEVTKESLNIRAELWLPTGVILSSEEPTPELAGAFLAFRKKVAEAFSQRCDNYAARVRREMVGGTSSDFNLDADLESLLEQGAESMMLPECIDNV